MLLNFGDFSSWEFGGVVGVGGVLYFGTIFGSGPGMRCAPVLVGRRMLETVEHWRYVVGHGDVNVFFGVVPLDSQAAV